MDPKTLFINAHDILSLVKISNDKKVITIAPTENGYEPDSEELLRKVEETLTSIRDWHGAITYNQFH